MNSLNITLFQKKLEWENPSANRKHFADEINRLEEKTDLILLPEMFTTGFTMNTEKVAESMNGDSMKWMRQLAAKCGAVICGSMIIEEEASFFNRLIWMRPDGSYESYDKRHLFRMANEDHHFSPGKEKQIVELKGWKICPLICYDLRFPVWSRNRFLTDRASYAKPDYDLLIYIANWPEPRVKAWEKLLYARAIENQAFVAGVNRIGKDGNQVDYSGNSMLIDPKGEIIWKAKDHQEEVKTITINLKNLNDFREKFPVGMDGDDFKLS